MIPSAVLPHRVQIAKYEGSGATGPIYLDPVTVRARVDGSRRMVTNAKGVNVIGDAMAIVRPNVDVTVESKLTHNGNVYDVIEVSEGVDGTRVTSRSLILSGPR